MESQFFGVGLAQEKAEQFAREAFWNSLYGPIEERPEVAAAYLRVIAIMRDNELASETE